MLINIYRFLFTSKKEDEIDSLNGLRALSFLGILFCHLWVNTKDNFLFPVSDSNIENIALNLTSAVDMFFILSGFLIYGSLYRHWVKYHSSNFKEYFLNRSLRIFPAYFFFLSVAIFATFAQIKILQKLPDDNEFKGQLIIELSKGLKNSIFDLTYLTDYFPGLCSHTWTLSVEEKFYLILPFLCFFILFRTKSTTRLFALVFLYFLPLFFRLLIIFPATSPELMKANGEFIYTAFHTRFDSIVMGMILAELIYNHKSLLSNFQRKFYRLGFSVLCFSTLLFIFLFRSKNSFWEDGFKYNIVNITFGLLVLYSIIFKSWLSKVLSLKLFVPIARLSYGMYLWHLIIPFLVLSKFNFDPKAISYFDFFQMYLISFFSTFIVSAILFSMVEYPFLILKERYYSNKYPKAQLRNISIEIMKVTTLNQNFSESKSEIITNESILL